MCITHPPQPPTPRANQRTTHPANKQWGSATVGFISVNLVNVGVAVNIIISNVVVVVGRAADVVDGRFINCPWKCPPGHRVPPVSTLDEFIHSGE